MRQSVLWVGRWGAFTVRCACLMFAQVCVLARRHTVSILSLSVPLLSLLSGTGEWLLRLRLRLAYSRPLTSSPLQFSLFFVFGCCTSSRCVCVVSHARVLSGIDCDEGSTTLVKGRWRAKGLSMSCQSTSTNTYTRTHAGVLLPRTHCFEGGRSFTHLSSFLFLFLFLRCVACKSDVASKSKQRW